MRSVLNPFGKFLITGGINSAVSYGVYIVLSWILPYQGAYAIGYCAGIVLSYMLQCRYVFAVRPSLHTFFAFPLIYVVQYAVSAGLLEVCIQWFDIHVAVAPLLIMAVIAPTTYVASKCVLTWKSRSHSSEMQ